MAKPIVDGLERELTGRASIIRLDATGGLGSQMARRFGVSGLPTLLVFDGKGNLVYRQSGPPSRDRVLQAVKDLSD